MAVDTALVSLLSDDSRNQADKLDVIDRDWCQRLLTLPDRELSIAFIASFGIAVRGHGLCYR